MLRVFEEGGVSKVNVRFQRPATVDNAGRSAFHGKGLLVYGVPGPAIRQRHRTDECRSRACPAG